MTNGIQPDLRRFVTDGMNPATRSIAPAMREHSRSGRLLGSRRAVANRHFAVWQPYLTCLPRSPAAGTGRAAESLDPVHPTFLRRQNDRQCAWGCAQR